MNTGGHDLLPDTAPHTQINVNLDNYSAHYSAPRQPTEQSEDSEEEHLVMDFSDSDDF